MMHEFLEKKQQLAICSSDKITIVIYIYIKSISMIYLFSQQTLKIIIGSQVVGDMESTLLTFYSSHGCHVSLIIASINMVVSQATCSVLLLLIILD